MASTRAWFLRYDAFPKLQGRQLGCGIERRTAEIRKLAREAHRHGMDFVLWDHELVFPDNMLTGISGDARRRLSVLLFPSLGVPVPGCQVG